MQPPKTWMEQYLAPLVGAKVTSVEVVEEDSGFGKEEWPTIHLRLPDGSDIKLEISQDPEGNGPGFPFGLPLPQTQGDEA